MTLVSFTKMKNNSLSKRHFSFEKVVIKTEIGFQEKDPSLFFVRFCVENRKSDLHFRFPTQTSCRLRKWEKLCILSDTSFSNSSYFVVAVDFFAIYFYFLY